MLRSLIPIVLAVSICNLVQGATAGKARLIALQAACENFVCKLSEQRQPDIRDLKQQVTKVIADRGFVNAVVDISFYSSVHIATMEVDHDQFRIQVQAENGKLTSTNLYVK